MNKEIRVAQMSDLHYSPENLAEADRCFSAAVSQAIELGVDAAVLTGDSTDHALQAHSPALLALAKQVLRLANHCPVLMLQGTFSHEPVGLLQMFALLGSRYPVCIADRIATYGLARTGFEQVQQDVDYQMVVHALPTLNKADIAMSAKSEVGAAAQLAGDLVASVLQGCPCGLF
jgi:exonuclease SbcD